MAGVPWSNNTEFSQQPTILATDRVMGLRSGANSKFLGVLASTAQVTGLDPALADKASLANTNTFAGINNFNDLANFNANTEFSADVLMDSDLEIDGGLVVNDYAIIKQIQNPLISNITPSNAITGSGTLTSLQILKGILVFTPSSGTSTWQLPSASSMDTDTGNINVNRGGWIRLINTSTTDIVSITASSDFLLSLLIDSTALTLPPLSFVDLQYVKISSGPSVYVLNGPSIGYGNMYYEKYTHTTTFTGPYASPPSADILLTKVGSLVTAQIPLTTATSSISAIITMNTAFPTRFRPSIEMKYQSIPILNNSLPATNTSLKITTAGVITAYNSIAYTTNFTASGTCGFNGAFCLQWHV